MHNYNLLSTKLDKILGREILLWLRDSRTRSEELGWDKEVIDILRICYTIFLK